MRLARLAQARGALLNHGEEQLADGPEVAVDERARAAGRLRDVGGTELIQRPLGEQGAGRFDDLLAALLGAHPPPARRSLRRLGGHLGLWLRHRQETPLDLLAGIPVALLASILISSHTRGRVS